jgi:hypothetical protein
MAGSRRIAFFSRADAKALARKRARPQRTPISTKCRRGMSK